MSEILSEAEPILVFVTSCEDEKELWKNTSEKCILRFYVTRNENILQIFQETTVQMQKITNGKFHQNQKICNIEFVYDGRGRYGNRYWKVTLESAKSTVSKFSFEKYKSRCVVS
jgi:hypothetical protein